LETAQQLLSAGIEEYLSPDGVSVVEWAERLAKEELRMQNAETKRRMLSVCIEILSETERKIIYEDFL
jgi:tRNA A37 threonylcarbamoyladenosine biosynthesis protein TsaE